MTSRSVGSAATLGGAGSQMRHIASARGVLANCASGVALFAVLAMACAPQARGQLAVCGDIKFEIKKRLSLDCQAFDAVTRINNDLPTDAIENVGVDLAFQDQAGNVVVATSDPNNTGPSFFARINLVKIADRQVEG